MENCKSLKTVARIYTGFSQKFGIPRQSGIVSTAMGKIVFEKPFRDYKYIEGLEEFDYLWLLWDFSLNKENDGATVRPPRLGGKKHMGVFATRAPFRPNNIGLSSVKIESIELDEKLGPVINVSGVDMLDGTPIYDIKPYLPYADCHEGAKGGFADRVVANIEVDFSEELQAKLPEKLRRTVVELLRQDPRAAYDKEKEREYLFSYSGFDIGFIANKDKIVVTKVIEL